MAKYSSLFELSDVDMKILEKNLRLLPSIDERIKQRKGFLKRTKEAEPDSFIKEQERFKQAVINLLNDCSNVERQLIHLKFWQFEEETTWKQSIKLLEESYSSKAFRKSVLTRLARNLGWL